MFLRLCTITRQLVWSCFTGLGGWLLMWWIDLYRVMMNCVRMNHLFSCLRKIDLSSWVRMIYLFSWMRIIIIFCRVKIIHLFSWMRMMRLFSWVSRNLFSRFPWIFRLMMMHKLPWWMHRLLRNNFSRITNLMYKLSIAMRVRVLMIVLGIRLVWMFNYSFFRYNF